MLQKTRLYTEDGELYDDVSMEYPLPGVIITEGADRIFVVNPATLGSEFVDYYQAKEVKTLSDLRLASKCRMWQRGEEG